MNWSPIWFLMKFKVIWHDTGCLVVAEDGSRMAFVGRRHTQEEIDQYDTKSAVAKLTGAQWKRFR